MFLSQLHLIITTFVLALVVPNFVVSLAIISSPTIIPATLPLPTSPARMLARRATACGTGYCPQGSTCCSNNTCCPSSTLCTRTPTNLVGCCPIGTVCDGIPAGYGEVVDGGSILATGQPQGQNEIDNSLLGVENGNKNQTAISDSLVGTDAANNGDGTATTEISINADDDTGASSSTDSTTESNVAAATDAVPDVGAATIIGAVVGGIVGWMALCAGLFWLHKRYRAKYPKTKERVLPPRPAAGMGRVAFPQGFVKLEDTGNEVGAAAKAPRPYTTVYGPGARV